jgi:hypothetical protein
VEVIKLFLSLHASGSDPAWDPCTEITRILSNSIFIFIHLPENFGYTSHISEKGKRVLGKTDKGYPPVADVQSYEVSLANGFVQWPSSEWSKN